jgi:protein-S-isoprenylcysteine O-methyltransferase Ste14
VSRVRRLLRPIAVFVRLLFVAGVFYVVFDLVRGTVSGDLSTTGQVLALTVIVVVLVLAWPTIRRAWNDRRRS